MEKEKKSSKVEKIKESIRRTFRKVLLTNMLMISSMTYLHPGFMYSFDPPEIKEYKYEFDLIKEGDKAAMKNDMDKCSYYYRLAYDKIKKKHDEIGDGKDVKTDYAFAYATYSLARAPPEPKIAEKYLLEALHLCKKYYEIWNKKYEDYSFAFLDLHTIILENLGYIYFYTVERIRNGTCLIVVLEKPLSIDYWMSDELLIDSNNFINLRYKYKKVIRSSNFTEILYYYEIAKKWYEEYLKFYKERMEPALKKWLEEGYDVKYLVEDYKKTNERVLSHLKIIDEILSKYKSDYKKEEKVETKEEEKKEEKKEEKINWKELGNRDIQEGL